MRIENIPSLMAHSLLAALPKAAESFSVTREEKAPAAAPLPPQQANVTNPVPSVAMLVTLAAADPMMDRRRRLAAQAERGVEMLDHLHKEVLVGTPSVERLREIAQWSQTLDTPDEPVLAQIMAEIDLRVRVELAKYDVEA
ncbi:flagellar assembly protein FliX [Sphingomonas sp. S2-65]|uniref:flagellar assembly protein FliX n=1 Tax=Sphingomonas sp. S2-65 TaxID=2903960 RepID=UPI001F1EF3E2|nr:flagellar assembly protein FliX [Sphingomonas sp. S2-65]UYY59679.1 flagellar trans-acting factor FliX [Sphingomonas sp. S2-65]